MLNDWFSSHVEICADNYNYSRFMLKDMCRSVKCELYLYGDMTIKVMESRRAVFGLCDMPVVLRQGMGS